MFHTIRGPLSPPTSPRKTCKHQALVRVSDGRNSGKWSLLKPLLQKGQSNWSKEHCRRTLEIFHGLRVIADFNTVSLHRKNLGRNGAAACNPLRHLGQFYLPRKQCIWRKEGNVYIYNDIASCNMCQPFASMYSDDYIFNNINYFNIYINKYIHSIICNILPSTCVIYFLPSLYVSIYIYLCKYNLFPNTRITISHSSVTSINELFTTNCDKVAVGKPTSCSPNRIIISKYSG